MAVDPGDKASTTLKSGVGATLVGGVGITLVGGVGTTPMKTS